MKNKSIEQCPRCQQAVTCLADTIQQCPCSSIQLDAEARAYLKENYDGCLCISCLQIVAASSKKPSFGDDQVDLPTV